MDRTLRRISLKKISVREKKADRPAPPNHARRAVPPQTRSNKTPAAKPRRSVLSKDPWWTAFGVVCVAGVVLLVVGIPRSSERRAPEEVTENAAADTAALRPTDTFKLPAKASVTTGAGRTPRTVTSSTNSRVAEPSAKRPAESTTRPNPTPNVAGQTTAPVAIQGCLQAGNEGFWLKDTSGVDAPASRSWRTGFLKKRSTSIEVVDASESLGLANYLGQRVAATGSLTNRRLQVQSLHRVSGSCD